MLKYTFIYLMRSMNHAYTRSVHIVYAAELNGTPAKGGGGGVSAGRI